MRHALCVLFSFGRNAQAANKRLIEKAKGQKCADTMSGYTADLIAGLRVSPEGQEGISAFLEKRQPAFQLR